MRLARISDQGRKPVVLHFADHDPTGIHMMDDLKQRLSLYARMPIDVRRIALTLNQARGLPPNTAKDDDSRYDAYADQFGEDCWELDALPPDVLVDLVRTNVEQLIDADAPNAARRREARNRKLIDRVADNWAEFATEDRVGIVSRTLTWDDPTKIARWKQKVERLVCLY